jgi:hypothetical protein
MSTNLALSSFAAPAQPPRPWSGGRIVLPAGLVDVRASGRLLINAGRVTGIILSDCVAMIAFARKGKSTDDLVLMEQLVGFLHAHGYHVVRIRIRFPIQWVHRVGRQPQFVWEKCFVHWVRAFIAQRRSACELRIPSDILLPEAMRYSLYAGVELWLDMLEILRGLEDVEPDLVSEVAPSVCETLRWWEIHVAKLERSAENQGWISPADTNLITQSDSYWKRCSQVFPGYEMSHWTTSRLL